MKWATAKLLITNEIEAYSAARSTQDSHAAWRALERAHIVSQPYLGPHIASHWRMLRFAMHERDKREIWGQAVRLALAPLGTLTGRLPLGNTGRANVSAFAPMPIPDDLAHKMGEQI